MTSRAEWNFADIIDAVAAVRPAGAPAQIEGGERTNWPDFAARTNRLARAFREAGLSEGDKVAHLMRRGMAYVQTTVAAMKARLVHVNVNYRYTGDELHYIFDNSDAAAIVYAREFAPAIAALRPRLPKVKLFLEVGDGTPQNDFAARFEAACDAGDSHPLDLPRSGADLFFLYTGGTTGTPKAVMWRQGDLWQALGGGAPLPDMPKPDTISAHVENRRAADEWDRLLVLAPMMHGTGILLAINMLAMGGAVLTLKGKSFDAAEALDAAATHRATQMVIVGDVIGRPLLRALEEHSDRWDLSALRLMVSSGTMLSQPVRAGFAEHLPDLMVLDSYGSSEGLGLAASLSAAGATRKTARFKLGRSTKLFTPDFEEIEPGSGTRGLVARAGLIPQGYYKDPEKTARTFPIIDGVRYSVPGDWAVIEEDGTLTLLGRDNACINTGGEKVFPEEVEEALKTHAAVDDALVVGVPSEKWGSAVNALVECSAEASADTLRDHVGRTLAGYKVPKEIHFVDRVPRSPNGKADYAAARRIAAGGAPER